MLISLDWLKEYVDIKENIEELDNALTMIGQEVEAIEEKGKHLSNVVVAEILEKGIHPDADNLSVCKVNTGKEVLQIICGAKNHKAGDKVAAAIEGAVLPGDFKIKKTKIRGVESCGMLCSEKELGISDNHEGIIILPKDAPVGDELKNYLKLDDIVFELEITPNRPDCLSHVGIAREIAAYYDRKVKYPAKDIVEIEEKTADNIKVKIEAKDLSRRYAARIIKNVEIKESPEWLKKRLAAIGLRSINNVVDVTNFILMEYGHPIHAFDLDKIEGKQIIVRRAVNGEKIVTLDDKERELDDNTLVIADEKKAVAIAGVMGGANSEVSENTKNILIEVAHFNADNVRKTSKKLGLSSDASYRFERGIDIEDTYTVIDRAVKLIQETAGGDIQKGIVDEYVEQYKEREVVLDIQKLNKFVGKEIETQKILKILRNLQLKAENPENGKIKIVPPSFREDIQRAADIYEEIIRMYGFQNIEAKMPEENIEAGKMSDGLYYTDKSKNILVELGLQEVITYSFIPENVLEKINMESETIKIKNPINEDMVVMRPTLIYSMLNVIKNNINRNITDLQIFEVSKVFLKTSEKLAKEPIRAAIAISGRNNKNLWESKPKDYDFYDLKGYVEQFLNLMGLKKYKLERSKNLAFHPGVSADIAIGKEIIGTFGEIHPDVLENLDIKEKVYIAEIQIDLLLKYVKEKIEYKRTIKYPAIERDLAVVLDEESMVGNITADIEKTAEIVENVNIFDVYKGEQIEKGKKSVAVNIVFRSEKGTLKEEEVNKVMEVILNTIEKKYNGKIRQ